MIDKEKFSTLRDKAESRSTYLSLDGDSLTIDGTWEVRQLPSLLDFLKYIVESAESGE